MLDVLFSGRYRVEWNTFLQVWRDTFQMMVLYPWYPGVLEDMKSIGIVFWKKNMEREREVHQCQVVSICCIKKTCNELEVFSRRHEER